MGNDNVLPKFTLVDGDVDPVAHGGYFLADDGRLFAIPVGYTEGLKVELYWGDPDGATDWVKDWTRILASAGMPEDTDVSALPDWRKVVLACEYHGWDEFDSSPSKYRPNQLELFLRERGFDGYPHIAKEIEFDLLATFAPYLINGDDSGLEPGELQRLTEYLEGQNLPSGHWDTDPSEDDEYNQCDATGLWGSTMRFIWVDMTEINRN